MTKVNPFALKKPCANCPFLKDPEKAIKLHPERVPGIINDLLTRESTGFACHKTLGGHYEESDDPDCDEGRYVPGGKDLQCAGALIVLEKLGFQSDVMQIGQRLDWYHPEESKPYHDMVIEPDDIRQRIQQMEKSNGS